MRGLRSGLGGLRRPAGLALLGLEALQLLGVDQLVRASFHGLEMTLLDMPPEDGTGHSDLLCRLGDGEQASLLHAAKLTEPATSVIDYHGCQYLYPMLNWLHQYPIRQEVDHG